jgi:hypothetical protein
MGKAGHGTPCSRQGPGDDRATARDAPIHFVERCLRWRLVPQEAAHLDKLARDQAPLRGQPLQTGAECRGERPGFDLA